ncbi:hypothetical protein D3C85_1483770 [compost metagenome]
MVSDKSTVPLSNASLAAAQAGFGAARTAMGVVELTMGVPVCASIRASGRVGRSSALRNNDKLSTPGKGAVERVVDPSIGAEAEWALLDSRKPIRPFI